MPHKNKKKTPKNFQAEADNDDDDIDNQKRLSKIWCLLIIWLSQESLYKQEKLIENKTKNKKKEDRSSPVSCHLQEIVTSRLIRLQDFI